MRIFAAVLWLFGAATDMAFSVAYTQEPPRDAVINFDELHGQAKAAIERLQRVQEQRLAQSADGRSTF